MEENRRIINYVKQLIADHYDEITRLHEIMTMVELMPDISEEDKNKIMLDIVRGKR